jgi:hypothetical protein
MASAVCPPGAICSDVIVTTIDGKPYYTVSSTKVIQGNDGKVNGGETTILYSQKPNVYIPAATTKDGGKTWNYAKYKQGDDIPSGKKVGDEIFGNQAKKSLESGALKTNTNQQVKTAATKASIPPEQQKPLTLNQNTATPKETDTVAQQAALGKEAETSYDNTRKKYGDVKYPKYLKAEEQDCIKFSIIEYKPSGLQAQTPGGRTVSLLNNNPIIKGREKNIIGTITLPIPAGISDQNLVNWAEDSMSPFKQGLATIAEGGISGGGEGAKSGADTALKNALGGGTGALKQLATAKFTEFASGTSNILGRMYGAVENPNMELLFSGPALRNFNFRFKLSPRGPEEAKDVRTIIRYFKQAMSVKRTESTLLLKAPHTFAISYISGNIQHPYLTKFKECALTGCSVDYTPYGTYMTYGKGRDIDTHSMVGYELTLTFQELEPLFDDEYGKETLITNVGY